MTSLVLLQILELNPVSFYDFAIYLIIWIKVPFLYFRRILRVAAKRKATEDISQRPSKVIRSVLCDIQEDHLQPKDLRSKTQAMYRERCKRHPSNPKSRNDVFEAVKGLSVKSSKGENLLQVIDSDHGIVIFTTMTNLNFLCSDISDIFKFLHPNVYFFFAQMYTFFRPNVLLFRPNVKRRPKWDSVSKVKLMTNILRVLKPIKI